MLILGLTGIVVGILNSYDHFTVPALSPVLWNLIILLGLGLGVQSTSSDSTKLYIYAVAILVATIAQFLLPLPWLRGLDGRLHMVIDIHDPAVKRMFVLMVPVTIGLGLININALIDQLFATHYPGPDTIAPAAIVRAFRLYMLPQGVFSVAVATVLFPLLSRHASREDWSAFQHTIGTGLRLICFLLVPASVAAAVLATPIVRLLYQHGHFTAGGHADRRALPRRIRARAHVQRDDADAQPRLLLAPVAVDPELGRVREPRRERGPRRRVLPVRDLGDPALDLAREHRRDGGAPRSLPAADGRLRARERRPGPSAS